MGNDMAAMESKFCYDIKPHLKRICFFLFIENLFNLKFAAKELERSAKKCEKDDKIEKGKLKKVNL